MEGKMSAANLKGLLILILVALAIVAPARADDPPKKADPDKPPAPVTMTTQEDHRHMMEQLKIKQLRPGANANNPTAANAFNYDEAKANPYPSLPDPLTMKDGTKVTTAETWFSKRRPEIVEEFDREVYGRVPRDVPGVKWEVAETRKERVGNIDAITKRLIGHVDHSAYPPINVDIQLTLTMPAGAKGPVPVMMEFGFAGGGFGGGGFGGGFGGFANRGQPGQVLSTGAQDQ